VTKEQQIIRAFWQGSRRDAKRIAELLGIPFHPGKRRAYTVEVFDNRCQGRVITAQQWQEVLATVEAEYQARHPEIYS
jgi:hypothetical protein